MAILCPRIKSIQYLGGPVTDWKGGKYDMVLSSSSNRLLLSALAIFFLQLQYYIFGAYDLHFGTVTTPTQSNENEVNALVWINNVLS